MTELYCDMDGVLVDLLAGYRELHPEDKCLTKLHGVGDEEKWEPMFSVKNFWEQLPKMSDANVLMDYFANNVPNDKLFILSAPQHLFPDCAIEKMRWLDENAPVFRIKRVHIVKRKNKPQFAVQKDGTPNILVDDYKKNIKEWTAAGGIGILHTSAASTIEQLSEII